MGLLSEAYSYGDTLKRKVRGLMDDPKGTLDQFVGQLGDQMRENSANMNAAGWGGLKQPFVSVLADSQPSIGHGKQVAVTPKQQADAQSALAEYGSQVGMAGATVWHGSPHKFDKFDSSKIGTGEGAQAYGHGLYLAESPAVAGQYQKELGANVTVNGKPFYDQRGVKLSTTGNSNVDDYILAHHGDMDKAIADAISGGDSEVLPALKALKSKGAVVNQNTGSLYKVDLPDEHIAKMLDWDKPLSQQHPDVQKAIGSIKDGLPLSAEGWNPKPWIEADPLASTFHNTMHREGLLTQEELANSLRQQGIPGIRYFDGGSRADGAGTSNFVVFPGNEDILKILERNGKGLLGE